MRSRYDLLDSGSLAGRIDVPDAPRNDDAQCFACGRPMRPGKVNAITEDGQTVQIGADCMRAMQHSGLVWWKPAGGGPRLSRHVHEGAKP